MSQSFDAWIWQHAGVHRPKNYHEAMSALEKIRDSWEFGEMVHDMMYRELHSRYVDGMKRPDPKA